MFFILGFLTGVSILGLFYAAINVKIYKGLTFSQMMMVPGASFEALRRDLINWFGGMVQKTRDSAAQIIQFPKRSELATSEV